jgi:DHA3 family macrolide efflux protein-like MFS transporter
MNGTATAAPVQSTQAEKTQAMRGFFVIWTGQALSVFGSELVQFALIWHLTVRSHSAIVLTVATLTQMLPRTVLGPFIGAWIDRWNRRYVMQIADALTASVTMALAILFCLGLAQIWHIYVLLFAAALGQTMHACAFTASTTLMVGRDRLTHVGGLNQVLEGITRILAPPAGALLTELLPIQAILVIDVATAVAAATPLFFVHVPQPAQDTMGEPPALWQDVKGSLDYVWAWRGLAIITGISMTVNFLLVPAFSLLSLIVLRGFGGGARELGWLEGAFGIGMLTGGALLGVGGGLKRQIDTVTVGTGLLGLMMALVGAVPANGILVAIGAMFLAGAGLSVGNGGGQALLQMLIAPAVQGRVFATLAALRTLMTPLGLALAGSFTDRFGAQSWMLCAGIGITIMVAAMRFIPDVVDIEAHARSAEE